MRIALAAVLVGVLAAVGAAMLPALGLLAATGAGILAWLVARRPHRGLLWLVGLLYLLPFAVLPVGVAGLRPTFLDATLAAILGLWALHLAAARRVPAVPPVVLALLAFLAVATATLLFGLRFGLPPENARLFAKLVAATLFFVPALDFLADHRMRARMLAAWLIVAPLAGAVALALYLLPRATATELLSLLGPLGYPTGPGVLRYVADSDRLRATGTAIDPNVFGAAMMVALVLIVAQCVTPKPVLPRLVLIGCALVVGTALLLTLSRGSWVGTYAGLWIIALAGRVPGLAIALLLLPILAFAGLLPGADRFAGHLAAGWQVADRATALRLAEYRQALVLIAEHPWFGVGFGNAPDVDRFVGVSSVYLQIAEQMGLIGLASYLLAVGLVFQHVLTRLPVARDRWVALSALAALAAALVAGLFDHHFFEPRFPHVAALFWLLAALAIASCEPQPGCAPPPGEPAMHPASRAREQSRPPR